MNKYQHLAFEMRERCPWGDSMSYETVLPDNLNHITIYK